MSQKPRPKALRVVTASYVLSTEIGPPRWVWHSWIPRGKVGLLAAVSDHGKTALLLQIAAGVAAGRPVLGIPTTPNPCGAIFYSLEDDPEDFKLRLQWVLESMEAAGTLTPEDREKALKNLWFASPSYDVPDLRFEKTAGELSGLLTAMKERGIEPALVIVETLSAVADGDESAAHSTRSLWAEARRIANEHDVTVIISHHYRKEVGTGRANRSSMVERIEPDRVRGSSANEGAARFVLQMGLPTMAEAEELGLDGTKALNKGYAILRASKLKACKPDMLFLERIDQGRVGEHTWARRQDGDALVAGLLKSSSRLKELHMEDRVLMELFRQGTDPQREPLLRLFRHTKDPDKALTNALYGLRKKDEVQARKLLLTLQGRERAKTLVQEADDRSDMVGSPLGLGLHVSLAEEMAEEMGEGDTLGESLSSLPSLGSQEKREILAQAAGDDWGTL